ncbi:hypothetical protein Bca4012_044601 [Brassica carinata]
MEKKSNQKDSMGTVTYNQFRSTKAVLIQDFSTFLNLLAFFGVWRIYFRNLSVLSFKCELTGT